MSEFTDKWQKVGALWKREKGGFSATIRSFSGIIDQDLKAGQRVMLFANRMREGKNDPDYVIYIARQEQPQQPPPDLPTGDGEVPF